MTTTTMTTTEMIISENEEIITASASDSPSLSDIDSDADADADADSDSDSHSYLGSELKAWIQQTHDVLNQKLPVTPAANATALDTTHITDDTSSVTSYSVVSSEGGYDANNNVILGNSSPPPTMEDEDDEDVSIAHSTQSLAQELGLILPSSHSVLSLASLDHHHHHRSTTTTQQNQHMVVLPPALLLQVDTDNDMDDGDDPYDKDHDLQNNQDAASPASMMIRSPKSSSTSPKNYSSFTFDIDRLEQKSRQWWYLPSQLPEAQPRQVVYYMGGPIGCHSRSIQITKPLPRPQRIDGSWQPLCLPYYEYADDSTNEKTNQGSSSNTTRPARRGVWPNRRVAYYEVEILDEVVDDSTNTTQVPPPQQEAQAQKQRYWNKPCIAVGVVAASAVSNHKTMSHSDFMPGWTKQSFAYHSDDGSAWANQCRTSKSWGPCSGTTPGDIIGCGMDYQSRTVFYTLNGRFVGHAASFSGDGEEDWIPTIGLDSPYGIACHFGLQRPFCFDLKGHFAGDNDEGPTTPLPPELPPLQAFDDPPAVPNQKRARRRRRLFGACFGNTNQVS